MQDITQAHNPAANWARDLISLIASFLGLGTVLGLVNLLVGVLSAAWLATQLWRFWRYDVHALRRPASPVAAPTQPPTEPTP